MATFIMLTTLGPDAAKDPKSLERLERRAMDRIRKDCPEVDWKASFAVLGGVDYLDIFEADSAETAARVSALIRTEGHARTEVWSALEWERFKSLMKDL